MTIIRINHLTEPSKCTCNRQDIPGDAFSARQLYRRRNNTELLQTVSLSLSSIGGRSHFNKALTIIKKIEGVKGACLFFHQTALRVYYDPRRTSVSNIIMATQVLKHKSCHLQEKKSSYKTMIAM